MSVTITIIIEEKSDKGITFAAEAVQSGTTATEKELLLAEIFGKEMALAIKTLTQQHKKGVRYAH
ncbi:hypothetical protein [Providencia manganoxydans]|uniref:hypothetical protein n=1 Tax=Providencia manganoxydans TaxID=2923283 RepID=UPI0034E55D41